MNNQNPYINIILEIKNQKQRSSLNLDNKSLSGIYYPTNTFFNLDAQLEHFQKLSGKWESFNSAN